MGVGYNGNGLAEAGMGVDLGDIDRDVLVRYLCYKL